MQTLNTIRKILAPIAIIIILGVVIIVFIKYSQKQKSGILEKDIQNSRPSTPYVLEPQKIKEMQEEYNVKAKNATTTPILNDKQIEKMEKQYVKQKVNTKSAPSVLSDEQIRKMQEEYEKNK